MGKFNVALPVNVMRCRDTGQVIVHTPALDLSSHGRTESEAFRMFHEAVQLFLEEIHDMGTMDDVLTELGWTKVQKPTSHWIPPELLHQRKFPVRIPACA